MAPERAAAASFLRVASVTGPFPPGSSAGPARVHDAGRRENRCRARGTDRARAPVLTHLGGAVARSMGASTFAYLRLASRQKSWEPAAGLTSAACGGDTRLMGRFELPGG